jgi:anti-sigma B factor antagonist
VSASRSDEGEFQVCVAEDDGLALVVLVGEIDLAALPEIRARFADVFAHQPRAINVDLGRTTLFGSEGIRGLLEARHAADKDGVILRISAASKVVRRVVALTDLEGFFGLDHCGGAT